MTGLTGLYMLASLNFMYFVITHVAYSEYSHVLHMQLRGLMYMQSY